MPVEWGACPGIGAYELTTDWECGWVTVPLDRGEPGGATVEVALSRPVLEGGDDRRPLVINPGGPGAPGVEFVWTFADVLPPELLDVFYPVGWDPRGVGMSRPAIECGPADEMGIPDPGECVERTGELLGFVGAADAALDLEEVRLALGVDRLDYLGYSYGTALGAVYAMAHPDGVGQFVLDGAIDPAAGDPDNPLALDGVPDYAADELDAVVARFRELCDASAECAAGPDSGAVIDGLRRHDPRPADGALRRRSRGAVAARPRRADRRRDVRPVDVGPDRRRPARRGRRRRLDARRAVGVRAGGCRRGLRRPVRGGQLRDPLRRLQRRAGSVGLRWHAGRRRPARDHHRRRRRPDPRDRHPVRPGDAGPPRRGAGRRPRRRGGDALGGPRPHRVPGERVRRRGGRRLPDRRRPPRAPGRAARSSTARRPTRASPTSLFGYPRPWIDGWIETELVYDGSSEEEADVPRRRARRARTTASRPTSSSRSRRTPPPRRCDSAGAAC